MRLDKSEGRVEKFDKTKIVAVSVLKEHREISLRIPLPAGRYVIVPSTRNVGELGPFFLSIYFNIPLDSVRCRRLDLPKNKFELIAEETESDQVYDWKIALVKDRIKYMIYNEDEANRSGLQA